MKKKGIYLVGAAKSGTTSLANNLGNHPDIDFNCAKKEPHYHIRKIFKQLSKNCEMVKKTNAVTALDDYQKTFSGKCQFFLDASTMYLPYSKEAIDSILDYHNNNLENIFIIALVREPESRIVSQHSQMVNNGVEQLQLKEAIENESLRLKAKMHPFFQYTRFSYYSEDISNFSNTFPNFRIIEYSDFCENPDFIISELFKFLSLRVPEKPYQDRRVYNKTGNGVKFQFLSLLLEKESFKPLRVFFTFFLTEKIKKNLFYFLKNTNLVNNSSNPSKALPEEIADKLNFDYRYLKLQKSLRWIKK